MQEMEMERERKLQGAAWISVEKNVAKFLIKFSWFYMAAAAAVVEHDRRMFIPQSSSSHRSVSPETMSERR